jgi:lipopolysaccharide export system protein LptA
MLLRLIISSILLLSQLFAIDENEIRIEANIFEANEKDRLSIFSGDVKILKGRDEINSSTVRIHFDENNQPEKYEFLESVSFKIHLKDKSTYQGKAEKVYLFPADEKYIFSDDVEITELETARKIEGNKVSLDGLSGSARIIGDNKKPVIMSFKIANRDEAKRKDSEEKE